MSKVKNFFPILIVFFVLFCMPLYSSALTIPTLYADVNNGTQVDNMVNYAVRYDSFDSAKYVAFRDSQNSYYLVWGDKDAFSVRDNMVIGSNVSYVRYYRSDNSSSWQYVYIESDTLSLECDKLCTTNLAGVLGVISDTADSWQYKADIRNLFIVVGCIFIALGVFLVVRRR